MPHPTTTHPSRRTVERIREILIGRQLESVEHRLERLESRLQPMPVDSGERSPVADEEFLRLRDEIDADRLRQLDETRRLSQQIQSFARSRQDAVFEARRSIEESLNEWFSQWQDGLSRHLREREQLLIRDLRAELERIRGWMRSELDRRGSPDLGQLQSSFENLAALTRTIADSLHPPAASAPAPAPPTEGQP